MTKRRILLSAVAGVLLALPASANHWRGVRATLQSVDNGTLAVDISVTGYTGEVGPFAETTIENESPEQTFGHETDTGLAAISWGDGELLQQTNVPGVVGGPFPTYRGAFSHTYEAPGIYTIRVTSGCCGPYPEDTEYEEVITGNAFLEPADGYSNVWFTNTVQVVLGVGAVSEVPLSRGGLFALAALLAGTALWLVRRG